jgi:hypothetical protein
MSQILCLSEYQANDPDNMIPVDSIINVDLFRNHYSIAYRDKDGQMKQARKMKTQYISVQLQQFNISVNEIH